jgi:sigma-B regulation protein RsbU (phosphoserine phosphatase)
MATPPEAPVKTGMSCLDTSGSTRIPILMQMVAALSRADDPKQVLRAFADGFEQLYGVQGYISLSTRGLEPGEYKITRLLLDEVTTHIDEPDPWRDWATMEVHRGGFLGDLIRTAYPEVIHHLDVKDDPVLGDKLAGFGSLMAIPLFDEGEPLNWSITLRNEPDGFGLQELEETILRANLGGATVKNTMIMQQLRKANETIRREVEQIASIQRSLLPKEMPYIDGLTISASYETYDQAGGDYYDFIPLGCGVGGCADPSAPWGIVIADAAGHGPAAAVLMAMLHAILHAYPRAPDNPGEILVHANEHLCRKGIQSSFVTAVFAIYDPPTRRFCYARAGHPAVLLKDPGAGEPVRQLDAVGSVPLGVMPDMVYESSSLTLEPGQTVILYTDGITEAMSPDRRMFGEEGIIDALTACSGEPACVQQSVGKALLAHEAGVQPSDDQTLVAIRVDD